MTPIAVIQDSFELVSPIREMLRTNIDFHINGIYYSPEDAMKGLQKNSADIVVLHLHSRQHGGIEWMQSLRKKIPSVKWIVYTMLDDDETIFSALRAGANGYILHNATPEQLNHALHELLRNGAPLSPRIVHKLLAYFQNQPRYPHLPGDLSLREQEIMHFTARGMLYKEIALQLGIQRETVKKHLSKIYGKLNVQNKVEAVNKFYGL